MALRGQTVYNVYGVSNYTFGSKASKQEKDSSVPERLARLRSKWVVRCCNTTLGLIGVAAVCATCSPCTDDRPLCPLSHPQL